MSINNYHRRFTAVILDVLRGMGQRDMSTEIQLNLSPPGGAT